MASEIAATSSRSVSMPGSRLSRIASTRQSGWLAARLDASQGGVEGGEVVTHAPREVGVEEEEGGDAPPLEGDMVPLAKSLVSGDGLQQGHAAVILQAARHRLQPRPLPLTHLEEPQHVICALEVLTG